MNIVERLSTPSVENSPAERMGPLRHEESPFHGLMTRDVMSSDSAGAAVEEPTKELPENVSMVSIGGDPMTPEEKADATRGTVASTGKEGVKAGSRAQTPLSQNLETDTRLQKVVAPDSPKEQHNRAGAHVQFRSEDRIQRTDQKTWDHSSTSPRGIVSDSSMSGRLEPSNSPDIVAPAVFSTGIGERSAGGVLIATNSISTNLAPQAINQLTTQIQQSVRPDGTAEFEIRLDPEELGKVRIQVTPKDGVLQVVISADRSDTLDLMRRHATDLSSDLLRLGYEGTELDFQNNEGEDKGANEDATPLSSETRSETPTSQIALRVIDGRLDIKL